jgi:ABC-2 type transport system permease protein
MNMKRLLAVIRKEMRHILRDRRSFITALLIPLMLMIAYCESLSLDVNNIPMVVLDQDRTRESRDFAGRFTSSGYFSIVKYVDNYHEMQRSIDNAQAVMGLTILRDFAKHIKLSEQKIPIQIILDGTDPNRGSISVGYTALITQFYSQEIILNKLKNMGMTVNSVPVSGKIRIWFNPSLRSKNFLVPALMALIMAILAALLTSTTVSKEWENGTMELLISTPVTAFEIVTGKFIPYFIIGIIDSIIILLLGTYVYDVPIKGSLALLALVILLFLTGMLMIGLLLSCIFRSSLMSNQFAFVATFLPTMLLSGFVFFIPGMPKALQIFSEITPARHFITCARSIFMKGSGMEVLFDHMVFLFIFDVIMIALTIRSFKKTLDVRQ